MTTRQRMDDLPIILSGVVGSTAYGLATPESDIDFLGVFAEPTESFGGLRPVTESYHQTDPDWTAHELGKFCQLAIKGNPSVIELLWLPPELYRTVTTLGEQLVGLRRAFLSAGHIRNTYLGYAVGQFKRLESRGDGAFASDLRKRTRKHATHLARLLHQGFDLFATGKLVVRLPQERIEWARSIGDYAAAGDLRPVSTVLNTYVKLFNNAVSALPVEPNTAAIESWLRATRRHLAVESAGPWRCGTRDHVAAPGVADVAVDHTD